MKSRDLYNIPDVQSDHDSRKIAIDKVGIKAIRAVLANIDDKGELKQVSFGTAMGDTMQFYKDIALTSMPYGQSLAICALGEFLRTYI